MSAHDPIPDSSEKYCVVGAGPAGLTALKNLLALGLPAEACEREDDVGGNWYYGRASSSVYASTHMISSKRLTEYTDFPMPADYPPYPSHEQALAYLRSYAERFDLRRHIRFETTVTSARPADSDAGGGGGWLVRTNRDPAPRRYRGVLIANGHHWDPLVPEFAGEFTGATLHSRDYKTPDVLAGRRVLVVGGGNSGCDLAVEAAQHAAKVFLSLRRGYHFLPKFIYGRPIDAVGDWLHRWRAPLWLRRLATRYALRVAQGPPANYGLPAPDHQLFETHPIVNSQLLYFAGHGRVQVRPDVERFAGRRARFVDGREEEVDLVLLATGFKLSFPFLDPDELPRDEAGPLLYLNVFSPRRDNLFVIGMIQPDSGIWGLADLQAQLVARYLAARRRDPRATAWFDRARAAPRRDLHGGVRFTPSPRHAIEVEYFGYKRRLQKLLARFGGQPTGRWEPSPAPSAAPAPAQR